MSAAPADPTTDASSEAVGRLLIVDDDPGIREVLSEYLARHGFQVMTAADASQAEPLLDQADLVVLDLMLPGEDGLSICRRLSARGVPVVMLSAMGEDVDRIVGLELGADDYLGKPCNPRELLARVRAVLRRRAGSSDGSAPPVFAAPACLAFGAWTLDLMARRLSGPRGDTPLSTGEFNLLKTMAERPRRVLTRDQLLDLSRGDACDAFDRAIDVQISRLRKKLAADGGQDPIRTVRGVGYVFEAEVRQVRGGA
ncbi:response regulator [Brevundimonas sp. 2R-24]|uniref:Response regulator n=2 Tax=Peiella sedimenti TaxID=3061083 RepID=A0ABT8SMC3_9CAUL|nr:response regulator [Caulobacteraceae bacterium XZ-24]